MTLTVTRSLVTSCVALALVAPAIPATAAQNTGIEQAQAVQGATFSTAEKLREVAYAWELGAPRGGVHTLTSQVSSQHFEHGYTVYVVGQEHAQAMSLKSTNYWALNPYVDVAERI